MATNTTTVVNSAIPDMISSLSSMTALVSTGGSVLVGLPLVCRVIERPLCSCVTKIDLADTNGKTGAIQTHALFHLM